MRPINQNRLAALDRAVRALKLIDQWMDEFEVATSTNRRSSLDDPFIGETSLVRTGTWFAWCLEIGSPNERKNSRCDITTGATFYFEQEHGCFMALTYSGSRDSWRLKSRISHPEVATQIGLTGHNCDDKPITQDQARNLIEKAARYHLSQRGQR